MQEKLIIGFWRPLFLTGNKKNAKIIRFFNEIMHKAGCKNIKQFCLGLILIISALTLFNAPLMLAAEGGGLSMDGAPRFIAQIFDLPPSSSYGNVAAPAKGTAQEQFKELVTGVLQALRYIIGAVAILMIVYSGFRMVTGGGKEEVYQKARSSMLYAVIGLAAVGLAGEMANIFNLTPGKSFLQDPNQILRTAVLFDQRTQIIITFLKYFIGAVAVFMIIRNGMRMITMGEAEDKIALDKKNLAYSVVGLVLIIMADTAINNVFYKVDLTRYPGTGGVEPTIDPIQGVSEVVGFTNIIVSIIGPVAIFALLAGGLMYISAGGEEEKMSKAKRLIVTALVGLIIIYGAFAIVSTFVGGQFGSPPV